MQGEVKNLLLEESLSTGAHTFGPTLLLFFAQNWLFSNEGPFERQWAS